MASRNVEIIITVRDNASRKLKDTERGVRRTGKAAKRATLDFKAFNRTLFATTAFVATFVKTFSSLGRSLNLGADLDRIDNQFERVLGPSGRMLMNIRKMTDATVDSVEAMKAGIALSNSGITKNSEDTARLIAMSAVAARRAGLDTTEGVKRIVQFAKSGSVASLEFLNLARTTDPAFTAQIELIKQVGGALGGTLSIQQKYAIGMRALALATKGQMHGFRDLKDVMKGVQDSFGIFRMTIGRFLGTALGPLIDKVTDLFYRMSLGLEDLRKNNKEIVFLAKSMTVTTASVLAFAGALGTLRLAGMALASLGFGLPKLILLVGSLGSIFLGVTSTADTFIDKLKLFGGFIQGLYQLLGNFDAETGISKIDSSLKKLLKDNKIFEFAKLTAKGVILVKTAIVDFINIIKGMAKTVDNFLGSAFNKVIDSLSQFTDPWDLALLKIEGRTKRMASLLGLVLGYKALKPLLGGLLSKVPVVGRFFGGKRGPKGTATDPLFIINVNKGLTKLGAAAGGALFSKKMLFLSGRFGMLGLATAGLVLAFKESGDYLNKAFGIKSDTQLFKEEKGDAAFFSPKHGPSFQRKRGSRLDNSPLLNRPNLLKEYLPGLDKSLGFLDPDMGSAAAGQKTSVVSIPTKEDTISKLDIIGAEMQRMDKASMDKYQRATEQALASGDEGAGLITDDEMRKLSNSFESALDKSKVLSDIKDNTGENSVLQGSRRGE